MALNNFPVPPKQIRVKLGTNFAVGSQGNGLKKDDYVILSRVSISAVQAYWSEDGTANPDPSPTGGNRMRLRFCGGYIPTLVGGYSFSTFGGMSLALAYGTSWWTGAQRIVWDVTTPPATYSFKDLFLGFPANGWTWQNYPIPIAGATSWVGLSIGPTGGSTLPASFYSPKTFSEMEEYEEPSGLAPDKTTYRYG